MGVRITAKEVTQDCERILGERGRLRETPQRPPEPEPTACQPVWFVSQFLPRP